MNDELATTAATVVAVAVAAAAAGTAGIEGRQPDMMTPTDLLGS